MTTAQKANNCLNQLRNFSSPLMSNGPDGQLLCCWDCGKHHLELEFFPEQSSEWFYRDRESNFCCGDEFIDQLPQPFLDYLSQIERAKNDLGQT